MLGDGAEVAAVAALAGLDDETAARATRALAQAEVVRHEMPLGFVHPLVRAAVYRDISPGERELQHEQAAQILSHAELPPERIASHLLAIPPRGEAEVAEVLELAGRAAMQKGAAESAVAYLQRALDEPPRASRRAELLLELGVAELLTNGPTGAVHLREAYDVLEDPVQRGMAGLLAARAMIFTQEPEAGAAWRGGWLPSFPPSWPTCAWRSRPWSRSGASTAAASTLRSWPASASTARRAQARAGREDAPGRHGL